MCKAWHPPKYIFDHITASINSRDYKQLQHTKQIEFRKIRKSVIANNHYAADQEELLITTPFPLCKQKGGLFLNLINACFLREFLKVHIAMTYPIFQTTLFSFIIAYLTKWGGYTYL